MLKYDIKLGKDNFKQCELDWREKYLAPDLSVITGVTDSSYNLNKFKALSSKNSIVNSDSLLTLDSYNVIRQGFIVAKQKEYEVFSGKTYDYSSEKSGKEINYHYVKINDTFYYWGEISANTSGYTIDNILNYNATSGIMSSITISTGETAENIKIDSVYWIEDGKVVIDGEEYIYDKDEASGNTPANNGILKYGENGDSLVPSAVTKCDSFEFYPYSSSTQYQEVTKFKLTKEEEITEEFDRISYCKYYYYIKYKNHYCQIVKSGDTNDYKFICEIPQYVVSGGSIEYNLEPNIYDVYYVDDLGNEIGQDVYRSAKDGGQKVDSSHYAKHGVKLLDELKKTASFVYIDEDDICVAVEYDIINANSGNEIAIYLNNIYSPLKVGEKIELIDKSNDRHKSQIYIGTSYNGQSEEFAFFNGKKYLIQKNLCDKVIINDNEYDIDYVNGKVASADCIVLINDEKVPMNISDDTPDGGKVKRYGWIVSGDVTSVAQKAEYDIKAYDGILVNGKKYIIYEYPDGETTIKYASIGLEKKYTFMIDEIVGNSMYICKPFVNSTDFTDDFDRFISEEMCRDVVENQYNFDVQVKNKIFGETEITEELAFRSSETPKSSNDFYNLFEDLDIFVDSGYIHIPLSLRMGVANNAMQDDLVTRDFFEAEKKKAINPIVDMEKDIYVPKFIYGYYEDNGNVHQYRNNENKMYRGSSTIFKPIYDINLNFHFRTRNLDSWKVNDGYNQLRYSGDTNTQDPDKFVKGSSDNWFITDFYPYRYILSNKNKVCGDTLQQSSDLMGLLYFTNDDIYYQRSKVAKSFARVSFYDSTDPQTQSLLATSCIFVDEHKLFKKFIDNSRKNLYEYGMVVEPRYKTISTNGFIEHDALGSNKKTDITSLNKINKISINTEFLGKKTTRGINYKNSEDSLNIVIDENHRISSRLEVDNRYATDTSSEGFYVYIFREYAEKLHPKPIYMKIEFNHAGIGKMIPFLIPMHWTGKTTNSGETNYNKMYPDHALKLSNDNDFMELLSGTPLSYTYAQTYIPLYAVYDFEKKEYGYVFDSRYVGQDSGGTLNINLFEMKIANEKKEPTQKELNDIKLNMQERAIININEKQFNKHAFNNDVE